MLVDVDDYQMYYEGEVFILKYGAVYITENIAHRIIEDKLEILKGKKILAIIDTSTVKGINKDARKLLSSDKGVEGIDKCGIVVNSRTQAVIVNFYMRINKPTVPTKMFHNYDDAYNWVKEK